MLVFLWLMTVTLFSIAGIDPESALCKLSLSSVVQSH